ncbi:MAG TPA: hypothetical protein VLT84_01995 [Acidobacteriota bacterium]|nr:hypothetical protein [Acidobacteriota bacterium]
MHETFHVHIVSPRHGRGHMTFFDEPFGEQTPFDWAGGFTISYENGFMEGGALTPEDLAVGLDAWLAMNHWRKLEELEALVEV